MPRREIIPLLLCMMLGTHLFAGADDDAKPARLDDAFQVALSADDVAQARHLIQSLGANQWKERAEATDALVDIGAGTLSLLRSEYCVTDDLEVKLRIEEVGKEVYERYHVYDRFGFLGISQGQSLVRHEDDSRIPEGHVGINVYRVHKGTAADAAGITNEDVIIAVDNQYLPESFQPTADFGAMIRDLGPGTRTTLSILRSGRLVQQAVTLGRCPREMVESGDIPSVRAILLTAQQQFPVWWAEHFSGRACKPSPAGSLP